ncbi:MAG: aldo/keto reductase [Pseudomonadota bacterium]
MDHRRFGRTGLSVPSVTFGGGWVGGVLIHQDQGVAHQALDMAWEAGIDWIDTAADYGKGVSETVIGQWLAGRQTGERPGLSSKFRIDPATGDFKGQMLRSVEASLGRLGIDEVPVIFLHNQIDQDGATGRGSRALGASQALAMADTMETLREQGLCQWIGMTALGDPAALHEVAGAGRFDVAQVYYNMLNPTAAAGRDPWNSTDFAGLLAVCAVQDMGVMGIRVFAGGHLATTQRHGREIPVTHDAGDAAEEARAQAIWDALSPDDGAPAQAAVRFALAEPRVSTVVIGLGELDHLRLAIDAAGKGALPEERLAAIAQVWSNSAFTR